MGTARPRVGTGVGVALPRGTPEPKFLELGFQETPWGRSRAVLHPEIGASLCCGVRAPPCHRDGAPLF